MTVYYYADIVYRHEKHSCLFAQKIIRFLEHEFEISMSVFLFGIKPTSKLRITKGKILHFFAGISQQIQWRRKVNCIISFYLKLIDSLLEKLLSVVKSIEMIHLFV